MNLIPKMNGPRSTSCGKFPAEKRISLVPGFPPGALSVFLERAEKIGVTVAHCTSGVLRYAHDEALPEEGYRILVSSDGIQIYAAGEAGANYALTTLYHWMAKKDIPLGEFYDAPQYGWRGFSLDVCRHFFPVAEIKRIIEQAALLKLNKFHWHLSDDQGFRVESRTYPLLHEIGSQCITAGGERISGFYRQEEVSEIVDYAATRGIEVIPEFDIPGHSRAIQTAYPELTCSGTTPKGACGSGIETSLICGGKESSYVFLTALLDEMCGLFPGAYVHLGGDEAPKNRWAACPHCQRRIGEQGLRDEEQLQGWFMERIMAHLRQRGKHPVCWDDALASGLIGGDTVVQYWNELDRRDYVYPELLKGRKAVFSNLHCFYSNYGYGLLPMEATYSYTPSLPFHRQIPEDAVLGLECTVWTEEIRTSEQLEFYLFPRLCAAAEAAWTKERDFADFRRRVSCYVSTFQQYQIRAASVEEAFPTGEQLYRTICMDGLRMTMISGRQELTDGLSAASHRKVMGWLENMTGDTYTREEKDWLETRLMAGEKGGS